MHQPNVDAPKANSTKANHCHLGKLDERLRGSSQFDSDDSTSAIKTIDLNTALEHLSQTTDIMTLPTSLRPHAVPLKPSNLMG